MWDWYISDRTLPLAVRHVDLSPVGTVADHLASVVQGGFDLPTLRSSGARAASLFTASKSSDSFATNATHSCASFAKSCLSRRSSSHCSSSLRDSCCTADMMQGAWKHGTGGQQTIPSRECTSLCGNVCVDFHTRKTAVSDYYHRLECSGLGPISLQQVVRSPRKCSEIMKDSIDFSCTSTLQRPCARIVCSACIAFQSM